ncbi:peptidase S41 [Flavobacterium cauense R2A-7]|uniref:C-terminal processing protease CtpA/Prc n=1 Tax=Flavobacterium cauense R2A-7 TaxID=1341154 RepID=V6S8I3_9FLAO|nr:S41 family peptidase [Flavobacterium cauense]ESU20680.1 peptidase S41 [Flavobacterium cauense R2A-7]KGO82942.1 peptidase S41 [Flavobacterium cauense R2A-7]TWI10777.1 C-terminal processing protease CtpA/Prc [Flavobacterium cauense R2A-7]
MKRSFTAFLFLIAFSAIAQISNTLTPADKIYGLSKFWQEVNYNFIYLDKVDRAMWDNKYKELIASVPNTKNDYEYYRELQKFCALLKDGHTNVYFPKGIEQMNTMFGDYRLFLENIDGKAIITRTNLSKKDEIPFGSEIIGVNGKSTQQYIKENVAPYISSSTDYVLADWSVTRLLQGLEGETYSVKIKKPDNKVINLTLTHKKTEEKEVFPPFEKNRELLDFKWMNSKIAYLSLNSFSDQKIDSLFVQKLPELYNAKALIVDLRYNGGGSTNIGTEILKYLTKDTILYGSKNSSRLHIPAFKAWGKFTVEKDTLNNEWAKKAYLTYNDKFYYDFEYQPDTIKLDAKRIVVPTVLLLGHNTASAAEDFLIYADNQKHMIKMGEKSFGSTGQPFLFDLPGGGSARICTKKDAYPDGREFVGYGIKPDVEVKPTLNDYLKKKDPVVDKAVEYLKKKI